MKITDRIHTGFFVAFCALGAVVSLLLGITESQAEDPLEVGKVRETTTGFTTVLEAEITNNSKEPRCPDVRAAARDGEARDLAEVRAEPVNAPAALEPGQTVTWRATITLGREEFEEELDEVSLYVYEPHRCTAR